MHGRTYGLKWGQRIDAYANIAILSIDSKESVRENHNLVTVSHPAWHFTMYLCHRACPVIADTEGVGVTQYPPMNNHGGDVPRFQQSFVDNSEENPMVLPDR